MLGPSENNDSVVLLSERPLIRMRMSPRLAANDYFHSDIDAYLENVFMDSLSCFSVSVDAEVTPVVDSNHPYYELVGVETKRRTIQEDLFMRLMTL